MGRRRGELRGVLRSAGFLFLLRLLYTMYFLEPGLEKREVDEEMDKNASIDGRDKDGMLHINAENAA